MTQILVATTDGVVEFPDGGHALEGVEVNALAFAGGVRYAIADASMVLRHTLDGWQEVGPVDGRRANCLVASKAGLFVGTSEAHLLKESPAGFVGLDSFESAPGRADWYTPWGGPPDVRSITEDDAGVLYCNVHVGGIQRSDDGGATWTPTIDIHSDVHEVTTAPGAILAATAWGLASSSDGGTTWGFDAQGLHATYARAVAVADGVVVMSASRGPRGNASTLYRRPLDMPGSFERCGGEVPEWFSAHINTGCLSARGTTVAFGTEEGELYVSEDSGAAFARAAERLPPVRWVEML